MIAILAFAFIYGCAAACGIIAAHLLCSRVPQLEGAPQSFKIHPAILVAVFMLLGILLAARGASMQELGLVALVGIPLVGAWYSDSLKGIVPDAFTVLPLAIIAIAVVVHHTWGIAVSICVIGVAFGISAFISKGRGMGWGDVKLAALSGAVLGLEPALLALAVACFGATAISVLRDRGKAPIAFAPFMVVCVFIGIFLTAHG